MPQQALQEPRDQGTRLMGLVRGLFVSSVLFSTLLGFNLIQTASLIIAPFSIAAFRKINRWGANTWWGWCVLWAERFRGIRILISGDKVPPRENALVLANHQQMPDINVIMSFAYRKHRLGDLKFFVKDILKYVPGIGWGMLFLDCPFVKRDWEKDREYVTRIFAKFLRYRIPVWLISFAEGTRITETKVAKSQEFARSRGLMPTRHVQIPRTKGFVASVRGLRSHLDAVYDLTIAYPDGVPTLWQFIKGYTARVYLHVRRFAIQSLPEEDEQLAGWVIQRFQEKDDLLAHFYEHGRFPGALLDEPLPAG